jgi:hypothetical protein
MVGGGVLCSPTADVTSYEVGMEALKLDMR